MSLDTPALSSRAPRIAIVGAGAMGTSLAAMVGRVAPVVLVCRDAGRAATLFAKGARVDGLITAQSRPIVVSSIGDLRAVGGVGVLFIATKTTSIPSVAAEIRPILGELGDGSGMEGGPLIVSYQNGIAPGSTLAAMVGSARVLRMVLNLGVTLDEATGAARVSLSAPPHSIGCLDPALRGACERIAELLTGAGLQTRFEERIESMVWAKAINNAAASPVAALVGATVGQVLASPAARIVEALLKEGIAVAAAEGIGLPADYPRMAHQILEAAADHVPSMVEDIRTGRESEVGQLNRQIIDRGAKLGVPTPTHDIIDALIETFDWKLYRRPVGA